MDHVRQIFNLYSERYFNEQLGTTVDGITLERFNEFISQSGLEKNDSRFYFYDRDDDNYLMLEDFRSYFNDDIGADVQNQIIQMYNTESIYIIQSLFNFFDFDNDETLSRNEIDTFFRNLPEEYNVAYNEEMFNAYDREGKNSLNIEEFTMLLVDLNNHLIEHGHPNFVLYMRAIFLPPDQNNQPPPQVLPDQNNQPPPQVLPYSNHTIQGTSNTYQDLGHALTKRSDVVVANNNCVAVHSASANLNDAVLGFNILANFADIPNLNVQENPQDMSIFLINKVQEYLRRSISEAFQDQNRNQIFCTDIFNRVAFLFNQGQNMITGNAIFTVSTFYVFILIIYFLDNHSEGFQTLWAETFVIDCIEAYKFQDPHLTISNYVTGNQISCPNGIIERAYLSFGSILATADPEPGVEVRPVLTPEELAAANIARKNALLNHWIQQYSNATDRTGVGTIDGLREFIYEKISLDHDNNRANWEQLVNGTIDLGWVRDMFGGGARKYKHRISKKRKSLKKIFKTKRLRKYKKKTIRNKNKKHKTVSKKIVY
jgi:Ca2+-binding EF-hand superfamily protein